MRRRPRPSRGLSSQEKKNYIPDAINFYGNLRDSVYV
jgi:hypothetical protein